MGAMDPLDGDRLSYLVREQDYVTLTLTWAWARMSNRDWMLEVKVC